MGMQPFFKTADPPLTKARSRTPRNQGAGGCEACKLFEKCHSPKMEATGEGQKGIFVLAEAPGKNEDAQGIQLVGKSGRRLRQELARVGIDLDRDCRKMNAVNCRPPENRTPTDREVAFCRQRVMAEIAAFKPRVILALGGPAMKSIAQGRASWGTGFPGINIWQGARIPDRELGAWVIPTWHPAFMERLEGHPVYERRWRKDLKAVARYAEAERPEPYDYLSKVEVVVAPSQAAKRLEELYRGWLSEDEPFVAFDYETTGRKPYVEGHKAFCISLSGSDDHAIACLLTDETWPWVNKILRNRKIAKSAHNMKFEYLWTKIRALPHGYNVQNMAWDSMLAAFVLDNRTGRNGLKLQSYLEFGVVGYDESISPYLKSISDKDANAFNHVEDAPIRDLLLYCGLDSLLERRLAMVQRPKIAADDGLAAGYKLLHEGALALVEAEVNGIVVDRDYIAKQTAHLEKRIAYLRSSMLEYPEVKRWRELTGDAFNLNSGPQLGKLLTDLGLASDQQTASGRVSTAKSALEDIEAPFIKDLLYIRKLEKIKGTYLSAYLTEAPDGLLHPFYNLHKVVSYRGSCDSPNFQNIPKRDQEAQKIIRRGLLPKPGMLWFEADYSGIEVHIATTYHKDPTMMEYLNDPSSDMHRDAASKIFMLPKDQITKPLRQGGKNGFVFPQFYGDYYGNNAKLLWHTWVMDPNNGKMADGTHVKDWLAKKGIKSLDAFTKHLQRVEDWFWNERFPVYHDWREQHWENYLKKGYFRGHVGFIYSSIMDHNDAINYGTQGSAFHCLLWSFTRLTERLKQGGFKSHLTGQIHDCIDGCVAPDELNEVMALLRQTMVTDLVEHFKWINVPMDIEIEVGPKDRSWYEIKEVSQRTFPCDCGAEWGYFDKATQQWECPVCGAGKELK